MTDEQASRESGAFTDFSGSMSYGDYLHLDRLLEMQQLPVACDDEASVIDLDDQ